VPSESPQCTPEEQRNNHQKRVQLESLGQEHRLDHFAIDDVDQQIESRRQIHDWRKHPLQHWGERDGQHHLSSDIERKNQCEAARINTATD
jgi:hypothetical protein